jgi:hypothetical protein
MTVPKNSHFRHAMLQPGDMPNDSWMTIGKTFIDAVPQQTRSTSPIFRQM